mgnify:CR=1 FL=1
MCRDVLAKGNGSFFANSEGTCENLEAGETYVVNATEAKEKKIPERARKLEVETRLAEKERSKSPMAARNEIFTLFRKFDTNSSGDIDLGEFKALVSELGSKLTDAEADEIFSSLDTDHNSVIDFKEFYTWWIKPKTAPLHVRLAEAISSFFTGSGSRPYAKAP